MLLDATETLEGEGARISVTSEILASNRLCIARVRQRSAARQETQNVDHELDPHGIPHAQRLSSTNFRSSFFAPQDLGNQCPNRVLHDTYDRFS